MSNEPEKQEDTEEVRKLVPKERLKKSGDITVDFVEPTKTTEDEKVVEIDSSKSGGSGWWILWFFGAGILFFAAFWGVSSWLDDGSSQESEERKSVIQLVDRSKEYQKSTRLEQIVNMQNEIFSTLADRILRAQSVDELMPYIRHGEAMRAEISSTWKPWADPKSTWSPRSSMSLAPVLKNDSLFQVMALTKMPDGSMMSLVFVRIGGETLLDWDATFAAKNSRVFSDEPVLEGEQVVRVMISTDRFYPFHFPERFYQSFLLDTPDHKRFAWGYVKRDSEADKSLLVRFAKNFVMENPPSKQPMTLLVRHVADSPKNQWEIVRVLSDGWVEPLDEKEKAEIQKSGGMIDE